MTAEYTFERGERVIVCDDRGHTPAVMLKPMRTLAWVLVNGSDGLAQRRKVRLEDCGCRHDYSGVDYHYERILDAEAEAQDAYRRERDEAMSLLGQVLAAQRFTRDSPQYIDTITHVRAAYLRYCGVAPGPWQFYADTPSADPNWHIVTNASRMRVLANVHIEPGNAMDLANARLITAAPELLDMVRISIGNVRSLGPAGALSQVHTPYREWLAQLEAVYAKATGATPPGQFETGEDALLAERDRGAKE